MDTHTHKDRLISLREVSAILGVKKTKLYQMIHEGKLRTVKIGSSTRASEAETHALVETYLASRKPAA